MSTLKVNALQNTSGTAYDFVKQVVQVVKTDAFTTGSSSFVDVTGLSVSITPSSTNSKILVLANLSIGTGSTSADGQFQLLRGSSNILTNTVLSRGASVSVIQSFGVSFLDSPSSTSSLTYKVQVVSEGGHDTYINRRNSNPTGPWGISTITLLEVAA